MTFFVTAIYMVGDGASVARMLMGPRGTMTIPMENGKCNNKEQTIQSTGLRNYIRKRAETDSLKRNENYKESEKGERSHERSRDVI
jgi:hypothetical protein